MDKMNRMQKMLDRLQQVMYKINKTKELQGKLQQAVDRIQQDLSHSWLSETKWTKNSQWFFCGRGKEYIQEINSDQKK